MPTLLNREQWIAQMKKNGLIAAFKDDSGVWHGQDFLYPGIPADKGCGIAEIPLDAKVCLNRCCECFTDLAYRKREYGY